MSNVFDFDAFWAEAMPEEAERHQIKVFGETITLPDVLPARIVLKALRYQEGKERTMAEQLEEYLSDLKLFVGAERVERWLDQGMEATQIAQIYAHIVGVYTSKADDGDSEGNDAPPKAGGGNKQGRS